MIIIIDYGVGNVGSILNMLKKIGIRAKTSAAPDDILRADKLILPGVGAFDHGMRQLTESGLTQLLNKRVLEDKCPILGICLGMQLLSRRSEEGELPGLGWLDADTRRFQFGAAFGDLKIPHMGWNEVRDTGRSTLFAGFDHVPRFYFVHSYHVCCDRPEDVIATSIYGHEFSAAVGKDNIMGTQFHPEKSHRYGMQLLRNFSSSC
jgi:imidazole glycerol-phosphate synthase subunit HisH